jgi:hypothetical protein
MVANQNSILKTSDDQRFKGQYNKKNLFYIRHLNRQSSDLPHRDLAIGDLLYRPLSRHTKSPLSRRLVASFVGSSCRRTRVRTQLCFVFCVFKIWLKICSRVQRDRRNCVGFAGPENSFPLTQNLDTKLIFGPDAKSFRTRRKTKHKMQNTIPGWTRFVRSCENSNAKRKSIPGWTRFVRSCENSDAKRKSFPDPDPTQKNSDTKRK